MKQVEISSTDDEWTSKLCKYYLYEPYTFQRCELGHNTGYGKCFNDPGYIRCIDYEGEE